MFPSVAGFIPWLKRGSRTGTSCGLFRMVILPMAPEGGMGYTFGWLDLDGTITEGNRNAVHEWEAWYFG
ncbi:MULTISPECIES: hypothetical protein [Thermoactinomyces]|uniref:Uncharacterized protein n=1 Tax=Thermoactinomyces vulgaris TaxID=2026 RepID=A0ABS0QGR9_THEVU|nr:MULTISPECIES: hypothetical protein [Thermoactinomyces]KFZ40004.1 hypothetical protein JS81_10440 [Thermoactinomyces sp. Gus2-1]KYQ86037.1 hypothetical protein AYX07_08225 [Thermoactinomyces sp. AS95]MBH8583763.1 hypothetical protein [Thermoactinomyces sp. CICC 10735]MBH8587964.1 hypothetical protein [Thermoactinomyces vulgaris]